MDTRAYKVPMNISNKNVQEMYEISFKIPTRIFVQHQKWILNVCKIAKYL